MPRRVEEIASELAALKPRDFDYANDDIDGPERLDRLCDEMQAIGDVRSYAPILFRTMERLDDADLGSPGPLVHTLETWRGGFESYLADSIRRKPTFLTVWMVNRLLNAGPPDADVWLELLQSVTHHPLASEEARSAASSFLELQSS